MICGFKCVRVGDDELHAFVSEKFHLTQKRRFSYSIKHFSVHVSHFGSWSDFSSLKSLFFISILYSIKQQNCDFIFNYRVIIDKQGEWSRFFMIDAVECFFFGSILSTYAIDIHCSIWFDMRESVLGRATGFLRCKSIRSISDPRISWTEFNLKS